MMKKKALLFCLLGAMGFGVCTVSAESGTREIPVSFRNIKVFLDGKQLASGGEPLIYNGTTYLPIRAVGEALGKEVEWDESSNTVTLQTPPPSIETEYTSETRDDLALSVTPSGKKERTEILRITEKDKKGNPFEYKLYYYGLSDVSVTLDGQTLPLAQALQEGLLMPKEILNKAWQDSEEGKIQRGVPRCGGTVQFYYEDFTILEVVTTGLPRDFYITTPGIRDTEDILEPYYPYYPYHNYSSIEYVIWQFTDAINSPKATPEEKRGLFEEGLAIMNVLAKRDKIPEAELQEAIQRFREKCGIEEQAPA